MTTNVIPLVVKDKCVELYSGGATAREIYNSYFSNVHGGMSFRTLANKLKLWQRQRRADPETLERGTYPGFTAHGATVQVSRDGSVVQAWIKQHGDDGEMDRLIEAIRQHTPPRRIGPPRKPLAEEMLELPFFDLHFPLCDHTETLREVIEIVESRRWGEINIVIGQDMLHNDDFRGRTSSGRPIERVDMTAAWEMAKTFYYNLIDRALERAGRVRIIYSKGNHDESMSWAFVQMLKAAYPQAEIDDSMAQRKCILWQRCFIGLTHGAYRKSNYNDLRGQFTIQFAREFASAKVREIHAGHLHREDAKDIYGVMCRRLARSGPGDEWSDDEGYVGAHRRFMVFSWKPERLSGIYYV